MGGATTWSGNIIDLEFELVSGSFLETNDVTWVGNDLEIEFTLQSGEFYQIPPPGTMILTATAATISLTAGIPQLTLTATAATISLISGLPEMVLTAEVADISLMVLS